MKATLRKLKIPHNGFQLKNGRMGLNMFSSFFSSGVGSLVQLKSRELLVGSGSGMLSLVRDSSAEMTRQRRRGVKTDGAPRVVAEPTKSCLTEVRICHDFKDKDLK